MGLHIYHQKILWLNSFIRYKLFHESILRQRNPFKTINHNQLLIPGISNTEDFIEALNLGYKIVKVLPASKLDINFLKELQNLKKECFFIGAGVIKSNNLKNY